MIKVEVIKEFTLEKFNELRNIQRKRIDTKGKLYVGDIFECNKELADYLNGGNDKGKVVIKLLEIIPDTIILSESPVLEIKEKSNTTTTVTKPKKSYYKKKSKK